ncbi:MAG TPA: thioredoxin family protein [Usitatibacter sp.]|nr:thioredoxin family protein [Usitatibacter sp.]
MKTASLVAALAALAIAPAAHANAAVGQPAPAFTLTDIHGKSVNLADFRGRTVVLEWNNFGCPFVQKHYGSGNMQALQKKYGAEVVWLTVNSTSTASPDYMKPAALDARLHEVGAAPADYLMDDPGSVGRAYGARTTPHMFIVDPKGTVAYNGAIDDKRSTNPEDVKTARNYVAAALDEMKAGKPVTTASTAPYGCSVHYR